MVSKLHHKRLTAFLFIFSVRLGLPGLLVQVLSQLGTRVPATEKCLGRPGNRKNFLPFSSLGRLRHCVFDSIHHVRFRFHSLFVFTSFIYTESVLHFQTTTDAPLLLRPRSISFTFCLDTWKPADTGIRWTGEAITLPVTAELLPTGLFV